MNVLIVFSTRFGTTQRLARAIASGIEAGGSHRVRVVRASDAGELTADNADLLVVGAPTQIRGRLLGVRGFLNRVARRDHQGVAAAAFDTRMTGEISATGAASQLIARSLESAGCRLAAAPESFVVAGFTGPLADGEEERARSWGAALAAALEPAIPADAIA